jgi:hypothetical protein
MFPFISKILRIPDRFVGPKVGIGRRVSEGGHAVAPEGRGAENQRAHRGRYGQPPQSRDTCPSGQSSRCRTVSVCGMVKACQFSEGDIGEPHWVALSLIDMSEDYQCHSPAHIIVVIHPPRSDWQILSNAAVMTAMVSGL